MVTKIEEEEKHFYNNKKKINAKQCNNNNNNNNQFLLTSMMSHCVFVNVNDNRRTKMNNIGRIHKQKLVHGHDQFSYDFVAR